MYFYAVDGGTKGIFLCDLLKQFYLSIFFVFIYFSYLISYFNNGFLIDKSIIVNRNVPSYIFMKVIFYVLFPSFSSRKINYENN